MRHDTKSRHTLAMTHHRFGLRLATAAVLGMTWMSACGGSGGGGGESEGGLEPTIQGGTPDESGFYTFVVNVGGCTGTLISNRHVLTAAHCVCSPSAFDEIAGVTHRGSAASCSATKKAILSANNIDDLTISGTVTAHHDYFMNLLELSPGVRTVVSSEADIAIIELDEAVPLAYGFVPPSDQDPALSTPVTLVGFGKESCGEDAMFGTRRYGTNQVASITVNHEFVRINESGGQLSWKGDSGGPIFATIGNALRVVGVASLSSCNDDSQNDHSVYTNVARYFDWISAAVAGSQGGACGDFSCGVGETAELCCTDCGCPGGKACQQNQCNSVSQCAPNSTCCDGSGSPTPVGENGPNCAQECSQCNGVGTCVPRSNGLACAEGDGVCDGVGGCSVSTCGDGSGTIDVGEECDGGALGGATCASEGFSGGVLQCSANCTLNTSQCTLETCNNGALDLGEQCDGNKLSGATCVSQGFDGGTLACSNQCTFDTAGCTTASCNNGMVDGLEQCDGNDLNGATCSSFGYDAGILTCSNCSYDLSGCTNAASIAANPGIGQWTPEFTAKTDCTCEAGNEDCRTLYRGRAAAINGNEAALEFMKADGSKPSATISYWVVVGDPGPSCLLVNQYMVRTSGTWLSQNSVLSVAGVDIWPNANSFEQAPCGEVKYLFLITGGGGGFENTKLWFQKQPIKFTKICG